MRYARVDDGTVAEIITPALGYRLEEMFAAELVASCHPVSSDVAPGWIMTAPGKFAPHRDLDAPGGAQDGDSPSPAAGTPEPEAPASGRRKRRAAPSGR